MTMFLHYVLEAKPDMAEALGSALADLARQLRGVAGCVGITVLQQGDNAAHYVFLEEWATQDAYKTARPLLPAGLFKPVMAALATRPAPLEMRAVLCL